jgi:NAD(P)-dependent dehydrogenase (short-subunit alcohol dehydrogenase family)
VLAVRCDVADEDQVAAAVAQTVETFGGLDLAYNNAGIQSPMVDIADEPAEVFDRLIAVNLRGIWASMKHELAHMRTQGSGAIVNCSSLGGLVGLPGRAAYHASKHGVIGRRPSDHRQHEMPAAPDRAPTPPAPDAATPYERSSDSAGGCFGQGEGFVAD